MKTSPKIFRYIISLWLLWPVALFGQSATVNLTTDSLKWNSFIALNAGTDVISAGKTIFQDDVQWLNFFANAEFYRFAVTAEYGRESRMFDNGTDVYNTQGSYYRAGVDFNFLYKDPDKSALYLGVRYSVNSFTDDLTYTLPNPFWGDQQNVLENDRLSADWFELVGGIKVKLFQAVWLGYTGRFKFAVDTFEDEVLIPSYLPGYGQAEKRSTWEFNYWLIIRLPFHKSTEPVRIKIQE